MRKLPRGFLPFYLSGCSEKTGFYLLAGGIALALVSIAGAQLLLGFAILTALLQWEKWERPHTLPAAILWPTCLLLAWTIAATLVGGGSLRDALVKKLWLFSILFLVPAFAGGAGKIRGIYQAAFAMGGVSAGCGVIQFILDPKRDALHRIKGFMSIWMTFSGSLMLVLVGLIAFAAVYGFKKHIWVAPVGLAMAAALYFSQTRNAWLGMCLGAGIVLLLLKRLRTLLLLAVLIPVIYLASPADIQLRLRASLNPADDNTRNRIELAGTALRMIEAHPWIGVGQKVSTEALRYRGTAEFPDWMYIHLHNNFLQIAAERGIPGLLLWLWFMAQLGCQALRVLRSSEDRKEMIFAATAAIGGWAALLAAGMFEYNFGDSEVLMVFLFMVSAPHVTNTPHAT